MITFKRIVSTARVFNQLQSIGVNNMQIPSFIGLNNINKFSFAFMSLFENNKPKG